MQVAGLVFRLGRFPLRRATGKFDALVVVEGFFYLRGWLAGRSRAWIGYYPIARRTSPSRETAIFKPDQLSTSHVSGSPRNYQRGTGAGFTYPVNAPGITLVAAEYRSTSVGVNGPSG